MNKTTEALKLAEAYIAGMKWSEEADEALAAIREALSEHSGDAYDNLTDDELADLQFVRAVYREALAEPVKQEPVAWLKLNEQGYEITMAESELRHQQPIEIQKSWASATPLYAAPVDAKAIRAELIAKVEFLLIGIDECINESEDGWWETSRGKEFGATTLKAIRGLK